MSAPAIFVDPAIEAYMREYGERCRNRPPPKITTIDFEAVFGPPTFPPRDYSEFIPDPRHLDEVLKTEGPEAVEDLRERYRRLVRANATHSRDRCKYLNAKPPSKGRPNRCEICDGKHTITRCSYRQSVLLPGAKVGPCFVILCRLCGKDIDNTLICSCREEIVPGYVRCRMCDCCGRNMLSRCRCHFRSECSTSSKPDG